MNPERLAELRRQRDLVRQHLDWIEREIAAATGAPEAGRDSKVPQPAAPAGVVAALTEEARGAQQVADAYRPDPVGAATGTRRGCLMFTALVILLGALLLATVYLVRYRDRPLLFAPAPSEPAAASPTAPPARR